MSNYRQIYYHLVFRTRNSEKVLTQEKLPDLYNYIWGIIKEKKMQPVPNQWHGGVPSFTHRSSSVHSAGRFYKRHQNCYFLLDTRK
ncbi:hypothetical protein DDZ16_12025 [Marinilabilia rubra]|uniref:Transposase IS200-like domain-containing protein n=1 Tax=Marinilabilia rubra TaxID=2162893 RepID=A0A2U2B8D8_9BACT|nr:hypothetical protein DDZ16_12025 [Marinilabilia rubra]